MADRTVTVKASGGDYTDLWNAEAGEQGDLPTLARILTIEHYLAGDGSYGATTFDGWTTDATHYINVVVPAAARHLGKWDATKSNYTTSATQLNVQIQENFVRFTGFQFGAATRTVETPLVKTTGGSGVDIRFIACIFKAGATASVYLQGALLESGGTHYFIDCLFYDIQTNVSDTHWFGAIRAGGSGVVANVWNCTFQNCRQALGAESSSTINAVNVGAASCTTADYGTVNKTTCSTTTPTFVDEAGDDFHLAAADITWLGQGTADPGSGLYSTDIDGETIVAPWPIGADWRAAAAGGLSIPVARPYTQAVNRAAVY